MKGRFKVHDFTFKAQVLFSMIVCLLISMPAGIAQIGAVERYMNESGGRATIFYGKKPAGYPTYIANLFNHPYLGSFYFTRGDLYYDGVSYPDVFMRLDLYRNELVVCSSPGKTSEVILFPGKQAQAGLHGFRIINVEKGEGKNAPAPGWIFSLYTGEYELLSRRSYRLVETNNSGNVSISFYLSTKYYLRKGNTWYAVKSKASLLNVLHTHKNELNRYIREHKLNFRTSREASFIAVVKEYERIVQKP
jgi:hypothetical protein